MPGAQSMLCSPTELRKFNPPNFEPIPPMNAYSQASRSMDSDWCRDAALQATLWLTLQAGRVTSGKVPPLTSSHLQPPSLSNIPSCCL